MQNFTKKQFLENSLPQRVYTIQTLYDGQPIELPHCDLFNVSDFFKTHSRWHNFSEYLKHMHGIFVQSNCIEYDLLIQYTPLGISPMCPKDNAYLENFYKKVQETPVCYYKPRKSWSQLHYYTASQYYHQVYALKKSIEVLKIICDFYQNPITTNQQLIDFYQQLSPILELHPYPFLNISLDQNTIDYFIKIANFNIKKIYDLQTTVVGENFLYDKLTIGLCNQEIIVKPSKTLDINILDSLDQETITDLLSCSKFLAFYQKINDQSFDHLFVFDKLTKEEFTKIQQQAKSSMDKQDYKIVQNYLACKTDDFHLVLKLLVPNKFTYLGPDYINFFRSLS